MAWSCVTPYQLVSIADDGLARLWDVREAALKRCKIIRKRRDYNLSELQKKITGEDNTVEHQGVPTNEDTEPPPALNSTLQNTEHGEQESSGEQQQQIQNEMKVQNSIKHICNSVHCQNTRLYPCLYFVCILSI